MGKPRSILRGVFGRISGDRCDVGMLTVYFLFTFISAYSTMIIILMVIDHGLLLLWNESNGGMDIIRQ